MSELPYYIAVAMTGRKFGVYRRFDSETWFTEFLEARTLLDAQMVASQLNKLEESK